MITLMDNVFILKIKCYMNNIFYKCNCYMFLKVHSHTVIFFMIICQNQLCVQTIYLRVCSVATMPVRKIKFTQSEFYFPTSTVFRPFKLNLNPSSFSFPPDSRTSPKYLKYNIYIDKN